MRFKLLILVLVVKVVVARIKLNVNIDENNEVQLSYEGIETRVVTDGDISSFKIGDNNLYPAVEQTLGKWPNNVYVRSPTPWGDLYKSYNWEPVKRVLSVKSAEVMKIDRNPVVVLTQNSENPSNHTIKVNTGLSRTVENTMTTSWSTQSEFTVSQEIGYEINVGVASAGGKTSFSCTSTMGVNEEIKNSETIGTTSNVEVELKPGEAVTAVLTAIVGYLEVEVVHEANITGYVAVNYYPPHDGHHFHHVAIERLTYGDMKHQLSTTETVRINFYIEAKLKVYDNITGALIL